MPGHIAIQHGTAGVGFAIASLTTGRLAAERCECSRPSTEERIFLAQRIAAIAINAAAAVVIATGIFITLVSVGVIARPASESFTFGG